MPTHSDEVASMRNSSKPNIGSSRPSIGNRGNVQPGNRNASQPPMVEPIAHKPTSLILVEEIAHRVRNEFAQAIAVIRLAAMHSSDPAVRQTLDATVRRLHAYANAHHMLRELPPGKPYA